MKRFTSYDEIETVCEAMIKDFFRSKHYTNVLCVDVEAFVKEYMGLEIVYDSIAEPDPGRVGFYADGKRPLWVHSGNGKEQVIFPARTIVIDKFLLNPGESARKRFTIAHEGAHDFMGKHAPAQTDPVAAFHSEYDPDVTYSPDMLHEMLSINECFTNRAAACLMMPKFLVRRVLKRHNNDQKVVIYISESGTAFSPEQKYLIQKMADTMGASYTAFRTRLHELDLYDTKPMEEYLHSGLCYGGEMYAACN